MGSRVLRRSAAAARLTIVGLGGLFVALSVGQALRYALAGNPLPDVLSALVLVGVPGAAILYLGCVLDATTVAPETYYRIVVWALGGFGLLLGIVGTLVLTPGFVIDNAGWSIVLATAIGTVAGTAVGFNEARAFSRAHEAEEARRELERTVDRLEASNERLEQFAYAASHDLQEPLRMVSSYLRLIEDRADDELTAETEEYLEFAVDGADRMRAMIDGLLAYSRVETQGEAFEPVDLDDVLSDVRDDLDVQLTERDADLIVEVEALPRVMGDERQLRQVFQNLLSNALEYSGDERPRVHVSAERDGSMWELSVRDEGIGIDLEHQERIFEVFQRLHSRDDNDGSGIGLALCRRIVERHGGEIRVDSEPGEGATFSFTLPAADGHGERTRT